MNSVYIDFYDDTEKDCAPESLEKLRILSGRKEIVSLMADISGRIPGDQEVLSFCSQMLGAFGGWAQDDYSDHLWSFEEIRSKTLHAGHPFFDYNGWYEERLKKASPCNTDNFWGRPLELSDFARMHASEAKVAMAIEACHSLLTEEEYRDVAEYNEKYAEWGLALETLADYLSEKDARLNGHQLRLIEDAFAFMGMHTDQRIEHLRGLV